MMKTSGTRIEHNTALTRESINDEILSVTDTIRPRYYPQAVYMDKDKFVYNVYEYPSGRIVGTTNSIILEPNTNMTFDWDTGKLNPTPPVQQKSAIQLTIQSGIVKFVYEKTLTALTPHESVMKIFNDICTSGETFPRPANGKKIDMKNLSSLDKTLSQDHLPGVSFPDLMLREYGICHNGHPEWKTCANNEVYIGGGKCMPVDFETYRCLNHLVNMPNTPIEFTNTTNWYNYYRCEPSPPFIKLKSCPVFTQHNGTTCEPVKWCNNSQRPVAVPEELRNSYEYRNSYVSCENPEYPKLITCKSGLSDGLVSCNDTYHYVYIYSPESYEFNKFRIGRKKIDDSTGAVLETDSAPMTIVKEFIFKDINRSLSGYDKTFDMYIEYPLPKYYYDEVTGERKECKTFRDFPGLFKRGRLRVYSPALSTYLKFCSLSIFVNIELNSWLDTDKNLGISYTSPAIVTDNEMAKIDNLMSSYPDQPIYSASIHDKNILFQYNPDSKTFYIAEQFKKLREDYGYIVNTFYDNRVAETRVAILKSVTNVRAEYSEVNVIKGSVKYYENSFGYTFRREITPVKLPDIVLDSDCKTSDKSLQSIIKNVQNSVVINNGHKQAFCINGKSVEKSMPCENILGLTINMSKNNCTGLENIGPTWLHTVDKLNPKKNKYLKVDSPFNELNINANTKSNNLLLSIQEYDSLNI